MKLETHVIRAIEVFEKNYKQEALMHACLAIDGTVRNLYSLEKSSASTYKKCLREYLWIIERFMGGGIDLEETKWTNIKMIDGNGKAIPSPDLADIVYHIFRCSHAHAKEVPLEYELYPVENDSPKWIIGLVDGRVHMPENVIWALLAVSVFSKGNCNIKTEGNHFLTWQSPSPQSDLIKFQIKGSWGKESELKDLFSKYSYVKVKFNL